MRLLYSAALFSVVACISPPDASPDLEPTERTCGSCLPGNSAMVKGHPFSWLRLDHEGNDDGAKIMHFQKDGKTYPLDIDRNVLRYQDDQGIWQYRDKLVGSRIQIEIRGVLYNVFIEAVHHAKNCMPSRAGMLCEDHGEPYWTERDSGEAETYRLSWETVDEPVIRREVCSLAPNDMSGASTVDAVVFEGDYYDPETRNITETDTTDFKAPFNVACMDSLPAKMELSRRTAATRTRRYSTTIADDRQALARVWAAEYCLGKTFTETGHRIRIRDRHGWLSQQLGWTREDVADPNFKYEAVWDANGAVCLETPRLAVSDPIVPIDPDISNRIQAECGRLPPKCSNQKWFPHNWKHHGQFLTATVASK